MAAGDFLTWAVQAQDAPAHVARILQTILLNEGVVDVAGDSFEVTEDTGANMQVTVGSGTLGDLAVVEGDDTAGQGVYVIEAQNATVTKTIAASDPSDDRIDLVVLQNYDDEGDSSGNNDAEVEVIEGTPAGSPSAPSLPDSAIPLAEVLVGAGVTAITDADITDARQEAGLKSTVGLNDPAVLTARDETSGLTAIGTSDTEMASADLEVPSDWNTWDLEVFWSVGFVDSSGGSGAANNSLTVKVKAGGVVVGQDAVQEFEDVNARDAQHRGGNAFDESRSDTGAVTVSFTVVRSGAPTLDGLNRSMIARAWRSS